MKKSYVTVLREIEALQKEAEVLREKEVHEVIGRIREAIDTYKLSAADLGFRDPVGPEPDWPRSRTASTRVPRYRDKHGNVWSGRGPRPKWIKEALKAGASLESFRS